MNDPPPPLTELVPPADLPEGLEAVVMHALAKAREDRFPTMAAFGRALERVGEAAEPLLPPVDASQAQPLTAPGGTEPALAAASSPTHTVPAMTAASSLADGVPLMTAASSSGGMLVASAASSFPGTSSVGLAAPASPRGTEPALAGAEPLDEPTATRRAAWPWLVATAAVVLGLAAWRIAAITPADLQHEAERSKVVEPEPVAPVPTKAAASEPVADAEPATTTTTAKPVPSGGATSGTSGGPALTRRQIDAALRSARPRMKSCTGSLAGGRPGDRVHVVLRVDRATGRVVDVDATDEHRRSSVEGCMIEALRKAEFPLVGGRGTQTIKRTLEL